MNIRCYLYIIALVVLAAALFKAFCDTTQRQHSMIVGAVAVFIALCAELYWGLA